MKNVTIFELIKGGKDVRDRFVNMVTVFNKVKKFVSLPDGENVTINMLAKYYEVPKNTLDILILRHKKELESDGIKVLKGEELAVYKLTHLRNVSELKRVGRLMLLSARASLRVGMLLTDSQVAEKIRTELLNSSDTMYLTEDHRLLDKWTDKEEVVLRESIVDLIKNGHTITQATREVASRMGRTVGSCSSKWNHTCRRLVSPAILEMAKNNRKKNAEDLTSNNQNNESTDIQSSLEKIVKLLKEDIDQTKGILNDKMVKEMELSSKVFQLQAELSAKNEIDENKNKTISLLENTVKDRDDYIMRTIKEKDAAEAKAKRWQKKYRELEASAQAFFKAAHSNQNSLIPQSPKMIHSEPSKPLQRYKMERNGNLTEIK